MPGKLNIVDNTVEEDVEEDMIPIEDTIIITEVQVTIITTTTTDKLNVRQVV